MSPSVAEYTVCVMLPMVSGPKDRGGNPSHPMTAKSDWRRHAFRPQGHRTITAVPAVSWLVTVETKMGP